MTQYDIRWHQRLLNFDKALGELEEAVNLASKRKLTKLEEQGLIQAFEYNYELAWNCLKDFYQAQGDTDIQGSRDAFRLAFKRGLIEDGKLWMEMIQSRILTSHTYNQGTAAAVADKILHVYYPAFMCLNHALNNLKNDN
ncbi:MAG: nucleotidyltransferase [Legionella sp.]|nr:nucleotidyltransferase [Legionella sp.]